MQYTTILITLLSSPPSPSPRRARKPALLQSPLAPSLLRCPSAVYVKDRHSPFYLDRHRPTNRQDTQVPCISDAAIETGCTKYIDFKCQCRDAAAIQAAVMPLCRSGLWCCSCSRGRTGCEYHLRAVCHQGLGRPGDEQEEEPVGLGVAGCWLNPSTSCCS
ncbi:hypothetical protein GE21DRAFT_1125532 [Neurospora crassa]|nr:hypothetical protein GE21DRAFT_1125532 [Neurospora crassa]